ncbi:4Fe-4S dicluster domain-containing protein [Bacillota bacterium LX-D]|nr:4Fe-4S dicluster domain-containing protein [Bacillota bacterium LX-D]
MPAELKDRIALMPGGEQVNLCFLCGTCTAGCPVSLLDPDYNPRKIMRMISLGMEKELLSSPELWLCSQCHICVAHCPQDVRFADVMRVLRQMALEQGYVTDEFVQEFNQLEDEIKKQRINKIREFINNNRSVIMQKVE